MTQLENPAANDESQEIVKIKIDGASCAVNTIQDKHTGRGISLVCPFPALECDMPVTFKGKDGAPSVRGTIHRIGVEDDPESGLPRLRLSIRTHEQRDTVITSPPKELLEDAAEVVREEEQDLEVETPLDLQPAARSADPLTPQRDSWSSLEFDLSEERTGNYEKRRPRGRDTSYLAGASYLSEQNGEDPAWVSCSDLPCAEEIMSRSRSRRRKKLAGAAIWMGMVLSAGVGIYSLDRAGVIDVTDVRSIVSGITVTAAEEPAALVEEIDLGPSEGEVAVENAPIEGKEVEQVAQEEAPAIPQPSAAETEQADAGYAATHEGLHGGVPEETPKADDERGTLEVSKANEKQEVKTAGTAEPNEVTLILPTRWPAEYATAYRVRDPNGVVVDVPGGLVKREGWIESLNDHPMIRSVKALQRETGARFIVYVEGALPRFITTPDGKGVALRLYYESDDSKAADEVAMLR